MASLATGMIVALPITWLYVWVGLPNFNAAILHNQFSAVMVAIIAGVSGAGGLKKAAQKFGFDLFEPPADKASGAATSAGAKG
jgi:ABC-type methionine transport system permease subunit